jgi:hypothetical protein
VTWMRIHRNRKGRWPKPTPLYPPSWQRAKSLADESTGLGICSLAGMLFQRSV